MPDRELTPIAIKQPIPKAHGLWDGFVVYESVGRSLRIQSEQRNLHPHTRILIHHFDQPSACTRLNGGLHLF